jgi:hypothetical protein
MALRRKKYRAENAESVREKRRQSDLKNRERENERAREWQRRNPTKVKESRRRWGERNKEKVAEYQRLNREARNESNRRRKRERKLTDPLFALEDVLRTRVGTAFRNSGFKKGSKTAHLIGCSWPELKKHIEKQFLKGMTWENRGRVWHVDHILPLAGASTAEELAALCHFTNLRPLWARDNHVKHAKRLHLI